MMVQSAIFTGGQSQPERVAVLGFQGVGSYGEHALRHIHDGGEGGHGEEDEGGGGQHHVAGVQDDWHAEQDVGQDPAAERRPVQAADGLVSSPSFSLVLLQ